MGRTTIISIVNTNVVVLCEYLPQEFRFFGILKVLLYCIVLYCIVLYCIVLYCIVLYCIVLYCIVLYCIVGPASRARDGQLYHNWTDTDRTDPTGDGDHTTGGQRTTP